jgi:hypothetical protein
MVAGRFARWMYREGRPNRLARIMNRISALVFARGVARDYLVTLEVTGRLSGRRISLPHVMVVVDGRRYLVSMLGEKPLGRGISGLATGKRFSNTASVRGFDWQRSRSISAHRCSRLTFSERPEHAPMCS